MNVYPFERLFPDLDAMKPRFIVDAIIDDVVIFDRQMIFSNIWHDRSDRYRVCTVLMAQLAIAENYDNAVSYLSPDEIEDYTGVRTYDLNNILNDDMFTYVETSDDEISDGWEIRDNNIFKVYKFMTQEKRE